MFENVGNISFLSIMGVGIIILSLVKYKITRDKAEGLILFGIGLGIFGFSLIVHYIIIGDASNMLLILGIPDIIFAVLLGLKGMYELGTGKPRTYLTADQKINIIGSVALRIYGWKDCYCFKAVAGDIQGIYKVPIMYAIPVEEFSKVPGENSTFETDRKGKIKQDTIKGKTKQDIAI